MSRYIVGLLITSNWVRIWR